MATSNDAAFAALDAQLRCLRALPRSVETMTPKVAKALDTELRAQIDAGQAPDGTPWPPTEKGERALKNAGAALTVEAHGTVILAKLTGPTALHHMGHARGGVRRQVLPDSKMPDRLTAALERVSTDELRKAVTGE